MSQVSKHNLLQDKPVRGNEIFRIASLLYKDFSKVIGIGNERRKVFKNLFLNPAPLYISK